ncbi:unnamed protein product [Lactuca saligna]|uniref:Uncharacterized protein n=1 Tax=Lactuca saligna TaxID=75948 RepID=A0AA36ERG3_LACSI|nr:unnamed protein product [Lactuca saligna]
MSKPLYEFTPITNIIKGPHALDYSIIIQSTKIINGAPSWDDFPITVRMQKCIEKPYVVESSDSEEDNDEDGNNDDDGDEEDNDNENSEASNKEGADEKEDTHKDEEELVADPENNSLRK